MLKLKAQELGSRNQIQTNFLNEDFCLKLGYIHGKDFIKKYFAENAHGSLKLEDYEHRIYGTFYKAQYIGIEVKQFDENEIDVSFKLSINYDDFKPDNNDNNDLVKGVDFNLQTKAFNILIKPKLDINYSAVLIQIKKKKGNILIINQIEKDIAEIKDEVFNIFKNEGIYIYQFEDILNFTLPELVNVQ